VSSASNFLSKVKQLSQQNKVTTFSRSLGTDITLLPLSIKQQKDIIKTALDLALSPITFSNATTNIINSNLESKAALTILDKPLVLLALRANSLGPITTVVDNNEKVVVDFSANLNLKDKIDLTAFTGVVNVGNLEIVLKIPTLEEDYKINLECLSSLEAKKSKDEDKVKDLVGEIYIYELIKFIDSVKLTEGTSSEEVKFKELTVKQRVETLEALPMVITDKIVEKITKIREIENLPLKVVVNNKEVNLTIDSGFFTRE